MKSLWQADVESQSPLHKAGWSCSLACPCAALNDIFTAEVVQTSHALCGALAAASILTIIARLLGSKGGGHKLFGKVPVQNKKEMCSFSDCQCAPVWSLQGPLGSSVQSMTTIEVHLQLPMAHPHISPQGASSRAS
eukprot:371699-Pelagomonas_calceolata.AAC.3